MTGLPKDSRTDPGRFHGVKVRRSGSGGYRTELNRRRIHSTPVKTVGFSSGGQKDLQQSSMRPARGPEPCRRQQPPSPTLRRKDVGTGVEPLSVSKSECRDHIHDWTSARRNRCPFCQTGVKGDEGLLFLAITTTKQDCLSVQEFFTIRSVFSVAGHGRNSFQSN